MSYIWISTLQVVEIKEEKGVSWVWLANRSPRDYNGLTWCLTSIGLS